MLGQNCILEQKEEFCLKSYCTYFSFPGYCWEFELKRCGKNMLYETKNDDEENTLLGYKCRWFWQLMLIKPFLGLLLLPCSGSTGQEKWRKNSCTQRSFWPLTPTQVLDCASEGFRLSCIPGLLRRIGWEEYWFSRSNFRCGLHCHLQANHSPLWAQIQAANVFCTCNKNIWQHFYWPLPRSQNGMAGWELPAHPPQHPGSSSEVEQET